MSLGTTATYCKLSRVEQHFPDMAPRSVSSGRTGSTSPGSSRTDGTSSRGGSTVHSGTYRFLNFNTPDDQRNAQTRRDIRSHVTARQHRISRGLQDRSPLDSGSPQDHYVIQTTSEENPSSPNGVSPPASPLAAVDIREIYPAEWVPYVGPILEYSLNNMAMDLPQNDAQTRSLLRHYYMAFVLSDPASLHATLLVATSHYQRTRNPTSLQISTHQLYEMAVAEIRSAVQDDTRRFSDQLVIAIGRMAAYELVFGSPDDGQPLNTHMTALQHMVHERGGFQGLGLGGLLERSLLWLDANVYHLRGVLYFPPDEYPSATGHPPPDIDLFIHGVPAAS